MEEFLNERRSTISYKDNNIFRKYYKYASEEEIQKEKEVALLAYENGIHTPKFLNMSYSSTKKMFYSEFEFVEIKSLDKKYIDKRIISEAIEIIDKMPHATTYGFTCQCQYIDELYQVEEYIPERNRPEYRQLIEKIHTRGDDRIIHGDYSFENIALDIKKSKLIIFDFQNACVGPKEWDKAYLLATVHNKEFYSLVSKRMKDMIKIIVAMKYGRGIRKGFEIGERRHIYEYWWK